MNIKLQTAIRQALCLTALATLLGCAENPTVAPSQLSAQPGEAVAEPVEAKAVLMRMAEYLAKTPQYTVNISDDYDTVQASGQKIQFSEHRKLTMSRPNGLKVEHEQNGEQTHTLFYDGKDITVFSPGKNVYAQTAIAGGVDEAIKYFLRDLAMRLPLAMLLSSQLPAELERRTESIDYVEKTKIRGLSAHHLAGRSATVDYQVWVAEGAQPLPLRIVLTYKDVDGQPQFSADFFDWNLTPKIDSTQFVFTPTEGSRKIAFVAQLPALTSGASDLPTAIGEKP